MNSSEYHDVLFWCGYDEYIQASNAFWEQHGPSDTYTAAKNSWILERVPDRATFLARMEDYAQNGGPDPSPVRQTAEDLSDAFACTTKSRGEELCARFAKIAREGWCSHHLSDYAAAVHKPGAQTVLELATGAGLGTWAVLNNMPKVSKLLSMDFDFVCTQSAIGIVKALGLKSNVVAICANNWYMPFCDGLFDTVCTHYGLDETREVPAVLQEVARVLKPGGRFVLVARMNPWDRVGSWFELFGVSKEESGDILRKVRLYAGPETLLEDAALCGLKLTQRKDYMPENGHARVLMVFQKRSNS